MFSPKTRKILVRILGSMGLCFAIGIGVRDAYKGYEKADEWLGEKGATFHKGSLMHIIRALY